MEFQAVGQHCVTIFGHYVEGLLACLFLVYGSGLGAVISVEFSLTWKLGLLPYAPALFYFKAILNLHP